MSQKSETLTEAVRRLAAAERAAEGATLRAPEDLVAYRDGKLEGSAKEALERGLALNPEAAQEYLDLIDPSRLATPGEEGFFTDQDARDVLLSLRERIREEESQGSEENLAASRPVPFQDRRARRLSWGSRASALAAVLILAVAGIWISRLHRSLEARTGPSFASIVEVSPMRGPGRSLPVPEQAGEILLILHGAHLAPYSRGQLEITDNNGQKILARQLNASQDESSLLYLPVPQTLLPYGNYRIEIYGIDKDGRQLVEEYALNLIAPPSLP